MSGFGPHSSFPLSSLPSYSLGAVAIEGQVLIQARLAVLEALTGDPNKMLVYAAEIAAVVINAVGTISVYASTYKLITLSTDTPVNQQFLPNLARSLRVDRSLSYSNGGFGGFSEGVSEITLNNADGQYDAIVDENSVNGQPITCTVGEVVGGVVTAYAQFEPFARLIAERWRADRKSVTLELRDQAVKLDVPVQRRTYSGVGGLEGGAELTGKRRPFGDGSVFNATPTLEIAAEVLYGYHDGASASLDAVKDGGIELRFVADYATSTLLRQAAKPVADGGLGLIPPGWYGSCVAESKFSLGGSAVAQITCDFTGLNLTTADIIQDAVLVATILLAANLDLFTFTELNNVQPATVGYFLSSEQEETCAEMMTKLMRGVGGWWQMTTLGMLQVHRFEAPVEVAAADYATGSNLVDVDRVNLPNEIDPPPSRVRVTYARNFTILAGSQLYGQVSENDAALAAYLAAQYKLASTSLASRDAILADFPLAPDPVPIESYFSTEAAALAEAVRIFDLYTSGYKLYRWKAANALFIHQVGQVVKVTDTRLGLSAGKYLRLTSVSDNMADGTTEMIGFG